MTPPLTRRSAIAALFATGALALAGCSDGGASRAASATSSPKSSGFTFPDARKTTKALRLSTVPSTVVAQSSVAAGLWDAGFKVAGSYGELTPGKDGELGYQAGSLDLDQVKVIGSTYGEFDLDQYALLKPDLLIDYSFAGAALWYVPQAQAKQIADIAPTLGISGAFKDTDEGIATFVDLAGRLGANIGSATLTSARQRYQAAQTTAKQTASSTDLRVAVVSPSTDSLYVVNKNESPEFAALISTGLDYIEAAKPDAGNTFTTLSWEQADQIASADAIFVDARSYDSTLDSVKGVSAWTSLPAVAAGQIHKWYAAAPFSYKAYASIYDAFVTSMEAAKAL